MTDRELIEALKCCGSDGYNCGVCPCFNEGEADCGNRAPALAAVRLEELLDENEHLRNVAKKLWCEKRYCTDAVTPSTEGVE